MQQREQASSQLEDRAELAAGAGPYRLDSYLSVGASFLNGTPNSTASRLGRGVVTVVPVTSNISRVLSFQVLIPATSSGLTRDSKAQAEQVRSVDVARVGRSVGRLPPLLAAALDDALRLHLRL